MLVLFSNRLFRLRSFALALLLFLAVAPHSSAQIQVNTTAQGNTFGTACSLQEAIYATEFGGAVALDATDPDHTYSTACADLSGNWNTIVLQNTTYTFTKSWDGDAHNPFGPTATPIIFKKITIQGNGAILLRSSAENFRLFAIGEASIPAANPTTFPITYESLTGVITSGVYSGTGNLTLQNVDIKNFHVKGGDGASGGGGGLGAGGAIYVGTIPGLGDATTLTVQNSTFDSNGAVGGNGSFGGGLSGLGDGGGGGGLAGNGGLGSGAGGGGGGSRGNGGDYTGGAGGGGGGTVYAGASGTDTGVGGPGGYLCGGNGGNQRSFFPPSVNDGHDAQCAGGGGGGSGSGDDTNFLFPDGGKGAIGGGGGGGSGDGGDGGFGGGGGAGTNCASMNCGGVGGFGGGGGSSNGKGGSFGGNASDEAGGGGGALGGAIFNGGGTVVVQNSTFNNNAVLRGQGGGGNADNGGDSGGAIFSLNGSLTVQNSTITSSAASGAGGGIVVFQEGLLSATFVLDNTIIANNGAKECIVTGIVATSNGGTNSAGNLITANDSNNGCPGVVLTSDPNLDALSLNSPGNTRTMAIHYGSSPAVDAGDDGTALGTDQRGVTRPQGDHSDIGAYEAPPPSADLSLTKTVSASTAQPGDTVTYTIIASNSGPNDANSVAITDTLPSSLTFVSCSATGGTCAWDGAAVTVTYASLAASASATVTITTTLKSSATDGVTVTNTASVGASSPTDPNANNNSGAASFTVHNRADLAITKTVSAAQIEVGDSFSYTMKLTNNGPYDARNISLNDSQPAGVTFTACLYTAGTCTLSASGASFSVAQLSNGAGVTITLQATLNYGVVDGTIIYNTGTASSSTNDPDSTNNSSTARFKVQNKSDLFVSQTSNKLTNRQMQYTISVKNLGPYLAKKLVLNDAVPANSRFVSISPGPWTCSAPAAGGTGNISCTLATEGVLATQSINFIVKILNPATILVNNTASVSAATFDPNLGNNTSTASVKVGP